MLNPLAVDGSVTLPDNTAALPDNRTEFKDAGGKTPIINAASG